MTALPPARRPPAPTRVAAAAFAPTAPPPGRAMSLEQKKVVFASSLGTVFEWYDFYLVGALAGILAHRFFAGFGPQSAFAFALLAFAAGFVVRPFGALIFGRLGDTIGRKYTFIVTILVMGLSTFAVGVLPSFEAIGVAAPIILVVLRVAQGLALGGEYGGAAVYVAEHAPPGRRGACTAWIQTTATLGFFLSLVVTLGTRLALGEAAFADWGWRVPFIGSVLLLGLSVWIRLSLAESPAFQQMKARGQGSPAPLRESFTVPRNLRRVLLALLGIVAGQAVIWYTSQFYALFFLTEVLKVDATSATLMMAVALLLGMPFFLIFGAWSDRVGRKPVILAGFALAAVATVPLFSAMSSVANPALMAAAQRAPITVFADRSTCSILGNPLAREADFLSGCDIARRQLTGDGLPYTVADGPGQPTRVQVGGAVIAAPEASRQPDRHRYDEASAQRLADFQAELAEAVGAAGYPAQAEPIAMGSRAWWALVGILTVLVLMVTLVYGPLAAALAEMFPTRIRYTSLSLPYHLGNGWFGGLMPTIAFALVAQGGGLLQGLSYPVGVVLVSAAVCVFLVPESAYRRLADDD